MLKGKRIVILGGTSGIGLATAKKAAQEGASLVITGFKTTDFEPIKNQIGGQVEAFQLDSSDESATKNFFNKIGQFDYLTTPGSTISAGPFLSLDTKMAKNCFESKFWGQYNAVKYAIPSMRKDGAIVLFSGILSQRPQKNLSIVTAVNSAIEGLGRALAVELSPIRVNVIAPGLVDTPLHNAMPPEARSALFQQLENKLLVRRIGQPEELAEAVLFLMANTFTTGQTLYVDGGHLLS
jgi:NAD(P)-dependent dehydrogenase (short-subunit alcohol dehydrogenase family)